MLKRYGDWLTEQIGCKVQKIAVNAGFTCPNRDGTVGRGGCTYCNNQTFNPAYCAPKTSITQQLEQGKCFFGRKYPQMRYLAYFQAYTNTYSDLEYLRRKYEEALAVDGVVGLVIGTRPDCMPEPLLQYLETLNRQTFLIVEYGIESTNDLILQHINRGHNFQTTRLAFERTAARGILTGGHVILGLPLTHSIPDYVETEARRISSLPMTTLKIHQLQIIRHTSMAIEYARHPENFHLYTVDEYIDDIIRFVTSARKDIVYERFVSQSPSQLLEVPGWGLKNYQFMNLLQKKLTGQN